MIPFTIHEIVTASKGLFFGDQSILNRCCSSVSINSRTVSEGALYIPVIGEHFDGHAFIPDARENGALCVLTDRVLPEEPYILVPDVLCALQSVANSYRRHFNIPVIGITGSVGKTSTKEMVAAALSSRLNVLKTEGSLNNQTGVPQILFRLESEHNVAVIEMGTNHPGEISSLARMTEPTICLFTNIGVAHIEFFGTREGIFKGKTEMIPWMRSGGTILANGDDEFLKTIPGAVFFGTGSNSCIRADSIEDLGLDGMLYQVYTPYGSQEVHVPHPGIAGVYNSLAAIAAGLVLNLPLDSLIQGIGDYSPPKGRMSIRKTEFLTIMDDAYNANPDSMHASISVLEKVSGRKICILGDMLELGANSSSYHFEIGQYAAKHGVDLVLCIGPKSVYICSGANQIHPGIATHFSDPGALVPLLASILKRDDTILVKASRGIHLEEITSVLLSLQL